MTEKERYIKQAFKRYNENKKRLRALSFEGLRGVDYSKPRTSKATSQGNETALVRYLDEKRTLKNLVDLVDRVLWYYRLEGGGKYAFLQARLKGYSILRASFECYICETTAKQWNRDILKKAADVADLFNLW